MKPKLLIAEPSDFSPRALEALEGKFSIAKLTDTSLLSAELVDAAGLWVRLGRRWDASNLTSAKQLKFVASPTTGTTHLDLPYLGSRGIQLFCLKDERAFLETISATAELTWALILALARKVVSAHADVQQGYWRRDSFKGTELQGKTLGILGLGRLGSKVARYGQAFGMNVLYHDSDTSIAPLGGGWVQPAELFKRSDVLSVHIPANDSNARFVGRELLSHMKPGSIFVNTARGEVVDEAALADLIGQDRFSGVGLDVLTDETQMALRGMANHPLVGLARKRTDVIITPHVGGLTFESLPRAEEHLAEMVVDRWAP